MLKLCEPLLAFLCRLFISNHLNSATVRLSKPTLLSASAVLCQSINFHGLDRDHKLYENVKCMND